MAEDGLTILDGSQIREAVSQIQKPNGSVTGSRLLEIAESEVSSLSFGLSLPGNLKSLIRSRIGADVVDFELMEFDEGKASSMLDDYFKEVADVLKDDPLVVSVLDGRPLLEFLNDEDDFAMLAENVFTELDVDDTGKLRKSEIRSALERMGIELGVPPLSESFDLVEEILEKHGADGEEELGQAQFAQLLQPVLQDLADTLAKKHVVCIQNLKFLNGSKLKKILSNEELLNALIDQISQISISDKYGNSYGERLMVFLKTNALRLGLPLPSSNHASDHLYDQAFSSVGKEIINDEEMNREEFGDIVRTVFMKLAEELESEPLFHSI